MSPDQRAEIEKMLKSEEITNGQKMFDLFDEKVRDIRLKFASNELVERTQGISDLIGVFGHTKTYQE